MTVLVTYRIATIAQEGPVTYCSPCHPTYVELSPARPSRGGVSRILFDQRPMDSWLTKHILLYFITFIEAQGASDGELNQPWHPVTWRAMSAWPYP